MIAADLIKRIAEDVGEHPEVDKFIRDQLISFFRNNPEPDDDDVHEFAQHLEMEPHEFEEHIYALLGFYVNNVGKHSTWDASAFDPKELLLGISVEMEHTDCPEIALEIAKDHLAEFPDYYTRLRDMEANAKSYWGNDEEEEDD